MLDSHATLTYNWTDRHLLPSFAEHIIPSALQSRGVIAGLHSMTGPKRLHLKVWILSHSALRPVLPVHAAQHIALSASIASP